MSQELEEYFDRIERKLILGKLDALFLFLSSVFGLVFSFFQIYVDARRESGSVIFAVPLLFLVVGMPVYIGYYRGGILLKERDSIVERVRGWIYLVSGASGYAIISFTTGSMLLLARSFSIGLTFLFAMSFIAGIIVAVIGVACVYLLSPGILRLYGESTAPNDRRVFLATAMSAIVLGLAQLILLVPMFPSSMISVLLGRSSEPWIVVLWLLSMWICYLSIWVSAEKTARRLMHGEPKMKYYLLWPAPVTVMLASVSLVQVTSLFPQLITVLLMAAVVLNFTSTILLVLLFRHIWRITTK